MSKKSLDIMLVADNDLDGLFSAVILDMSLYNIFELEVETQFREELWWEIPIQDNYDILIMLDLAYDNTPNYRKASSRASQKAFAIDHHVTNETGFPQKVIAYNPCKNGECYEPTAFLVDRVVKKLGQESSDLSEYLTLLGVLADAGINFRVQSRKIDYFYDSTIENLYRNGIRSYSFLFKSVEYKDFIYPKFKETIEALNAEASDVGWKELYLRFINETSDLSSAQKFIKRIENKHQGTYIEILDSIPTELSSITKSAIRYMASPNTAPPNVFIIKSFKEGGLSKAPLDSKINSHMKLPRNAQTIDSVKSNLFARAMEK